MVFIDEDTGPKDEDDYMVKWIEAGEEDDSDVLIMNSEDWIILEK